ncbi:DUF4255 domain-containing protein [Kitasatospora sp. NPDC048540]|uniref:DUF4255 domain-containing protein n=1 Tax=unclassified Kitasatospora TaxID=2633591 RepID=UPI00068CEB32|nr:DUF4255 domain-containing protein [Kitasatospora sp. MBT63]
MFHEVDAALRDFLTPLLPQDAVVTFESPAPVESGDGGARCSEVVLFLYDVREDPNGRGADLTDVRDAQHKVVARKLPARRYQLTYLVSAQAATAEASHGLLGRVLSVLVTRDTLPVECLGGSLAEAGLPVGLRAAPPSSTAASMDLWSALKSSPRACLELVVTAPLVPDLPIEVEEAPGSFGLGFYQLSSPEEDRSGAAADPVPARSFTTVRIRERGSRESSSKDSPPKESPPVPGSGSGRLPRRGRGE